MLLRFSFGGRVTVSASWVDMRNIDICLCFHRQVAARELAVDKVAEKGINHNEHRHTQQHFGKAEQPRADDDGNHDPEAVDAHAVPQNFGTKDIAVKLLEHKDKYDKKQHLPSRNRQDNERRGNRADKRSKERDDVGQPDDKGNQQGIRDPHDDAADIAEDRNDQAVQNFPGDEPHKNVVCGVYPGNRAF